MVSISSGDTFVISWLRGDRPMWTWKATHLPTGKTALFETDPDIPDYELMDKADEALGLKS